MFFFFKQKTAYEIASCLVGSEMCIRDSPFHLEKFGREDHGFTVFSEEILYGYLLCLPFT